MLATFNINSSKNNFNLIRIYLSLSVVFFHSYDLSKRPELSFLNGIFNGERAVQAFFIISGYLVMKSYVRSHSTREFFIKRFRRIYPAYIFIIMACAIGGCIVSTYTWYEYFSSPMLYRYIAANLFFLNFIQPSLPGVFTGNFLTTVNGSLWTLKIEVAYYLLVPVIVFAGKKMKKHLLYALLFFSSIGYYWFMMKSYTSSGNETYLFLSRQIPGQLFYFIMGAWMVELEKEKKIFQLIKWLGIPCMILLFFHPPLILLSISTAIAVFFAAYCIPLIKFPYRENDISYGLYIYHFPVIQVLIYYGVYSFNAFLALGITLALTTIFAIASWLLIEEPFIRKRITSYGINGSKVIPA